MNLPNQLTVARFVMALIFVGLVSFHNVGCHLAAYAVFTAAAITDYYDGKIARSRNLITNFGKLLDPVADKVLLVGAFVALMEIRTLRIPAWTVVAIIAREFLITGVRSLAASNGKVIAADKYGKLKTVFQMVYVFVFFALAIIVRIIDTWMESFSWQPAVLRIAEPALSLASFVGIVAVAVFTIYSGFQFMRTGWASLEIGK